MATISETHECEWKQRAERLQAELETLKAQLSGLQRHVFGQRSEKLPRIEDELRKEAPPKSRDATLKERREKRAAREELPTREIRHPVIEEKRTCPKCGSRELRALGEGRSTVIYEYIPSRLERQVHVQEILACRCGEGIVTADAPKAIEKGQYGPGFIAHVVTSKCCDSLPFYRQGQIFEREGVPVARTTIGDLFHAAAKSMEPLYRRLLELIREARVVFADETPQRVLAPDKTRRAYVWAFRTDKLVAYVHSPSRSGEIPAEVLGNSQGYLLVDGYVGYNRVTQPKGRVRVGCWAHVRRKFFDALPTAPEAQQMLDLILDLYRVEWEVTEASLRGTAEHLTRRQTLSADVVESIHEWLAAALPNHPPKSPLGEAIRYTQGQWQALKRFLDDTELPLDNNWSENALRPVALGRKNYLFVGNDAAGENMACLYSIVTTCKANGVDPEAYLRDVLPRLAMHPHARLDELLPHRWTPMPASDSA